MRGTTHEDHLGDGKRHLDGGILGYHRHSASQSFSRIGGEGTAQDFHRALLRLNLSGQSFGQGGFTGAVGADDDEKGAGCHFQGKILKDGTVPVGDLHVVKADGGIHGRDLCSRKIKRGAPISAVTTPTDNSPCEGSTRANRSHQTR